MYQYNSIHLVAKDEKVTARNDLIGMSNHTNIQVRGSLVNNKNIVNLKLQNSNKLSYSSNC